MTTSKYTALYCYKSGNSYVCMDLPVRLLVQEEHKVIFLCVQDIKISRLMKQLEEKNYACVCSV